MKVVSGMTVYCRFRANTPIESLRVGARGGVYALIKGVWKYARKTRCVPGPLNDEVRPIIKI